MIFLVINGLIVGDFVFFGKIIVCPLCLDLIGLSGGNRLFFGLINWGRSGVIYVEY
jgi:hypothetical protein